MSVDRNKAQDIRLGKNNNNRDKAQDAADALKGASLAFGKPPVKPKPKGNTYSGRDGALAAATKVGTLGNGNGDGRQNFKAGVNDNQVQLTSPTGTRQRVVYHTTGSTMEGGSDIGSPDRGMRRGGGGEGFLQVGKERTGGQASNYSFIAATLAASRSASVSPSRTGEQPPYSPGRTRRKSISFEDRPASVRNESSGSEQVLDTRPIPPTTSLIGMFEQNGDTKKRAPAIKRSKTTASVKSPLNQKPAPQTAVEARTPSPNPITNRKPSPSPSPKPKPKPKVNKPRVSQNKPTPQAAEVPIPLTTKPKPSKPIPIPKKPKPPQPENDDTNSLHSSADSFVSASDHQPPSPSTYQPSFRAALTEQKRARQRLTSSSSTTLNSTTAQIDSLANAIVASSLATSRASSPARTLPPPPPPARRNGGHRLFHNSQEISRTPSPVKQGLMRTTMRQAKPLEEELDETEKRRLKKHLVKKHPNKHHEGDRKRWRDVITERERKRYEAVWASNKGMYTGDGEGAKDEVCNLVVRDVWGRSRLPREVLEEVYELVDRGGGGRLGKEEFVVGLWLIDQRLKGRKLPIRVGESVWRSVGGLGGIKVRKVGK